MVDDAGGGAFGAAERELVDAFRAMFDGLDEGFCVVEVLLDDAGRPADLRPLESNAAFARHAGFAADPGATVRAVVPDIEATWIETIGQVALAGTPTRFSHDGRALGRFLHAYAWPVGPAAARRVAIHCIDVTARKRANDDVRFRADQFFELVKQAPVGVALFDADLRFVGTNPFARRLLGGATDLPGVDLGTHLRTIWPPALADELVRIGRATLESGHAFHDAEFAAIRSDRGAPAFYDWRFDPIRLPDGRDGLVAYVRDVSEVVEARRAVTESAHRYQMLFESIDEGFCVVQSIVDEVGHPVDYRFLETNPAFERHTGLTDAVGRTAVELVPGLERHWVETYHAVAASGEPRRFVEQADALGRWFDVYAFPVGDPADLTVALLFNDVTEEKRAKDALQASVERLRHLAHNDPLTGLPNRIQFEDHLRAAVATAERHGRPFAVLFLDLDNFKAINDAWGHAAGDGVLMEIGRRLRGSLRVSDTLARLHGDEFAALLPELSASSEADGLARTLLDVVKAPIAVEGVTLTVEVSIGVSLYPFDGTNARELMRSADTAMYLAKQGGKNAVNRSASPSDPP
jgi:diguanylate cyclase (GGDEF)-like protein/PAS domain S-box-containing protein